MMRLMYSGQWQGIVLHVFNCSTSRFKVEPYDCFYLPLLIDSYICKHIFDTGSPISTKLYSDQ